MDTNKTPPGELAGMKKPRLTAMERLAIETGLDAGKTPYAIAQELGRPPKTVMREIRGRAVESDKGAVDRLVPKNIGRPCRIPSRTQTPPEPAERQSL